MECDIVSIRNMVSQADSWFEWALRWTDSVTRMLLWTLQAYCVIVDPLIHVGIQINSACCRKCYSDWHAISECYSYSSEQDFSWHRVLHGLLMIAEPFVMAALRSRCGHYIFALWFLSIFYLSSFFYSSPNLSGRRLDVYHTSTHGVALVRI